MKSIEFKLVLSHPDRNPDEVSNVLGIIPTRISIKGSPIYNDLKLLHKNYSWRLDVVLDEGNFIDPYFKVLMKIAESKQAAFLQLKNQGWYIEIACQCFTEEGKSAPSFHLNLEHISFMKEICAEWDLDIL